MRDQQRRLRRARDLHEYARQLHLRRVPERLLRLRASGCADVDECATNNGGCDALTTCTNTPGGFICGHCPSGYNGTGATGCTDIDECVTNNGGCDALTTCTNTVGGFTCGACPSGYSGGGASGCIDIDECASNHGGCDALATCTNTPGGFTCGACPSGYSGTGAAGCIDIDECATNHGGCDALTTCTNTPGGFTCGACPSGYSGASATGCTDIDECATGTDNCHADATCTNTAGSFTCACNAGLNGDGVSCSACESLSVGGTMMARPNTRSSVCIENPSGSTAEYVLIPMNLTRGSSYPLTVVANNLATLAGTTSTPAAVVDTHTASRRAHMTEFASRRGTTGSGTPVSPTSRIPTGVPVVGATWSLNGELGTQCASGTARTGTVRYVGTHAIIVTDNANPAGGLTTTQYEALGSKFDSAVYPSVTGVFGAPTDIDGNSRVVLFFTTAVNAHVTDTAASAWAQYRPRDVSSQVECPTSNGGEIHLRHGGRPDSGEQHHRPHCQQRRELDPQSDRA